MKAPATDRQYTGGAQVAGLARYVAGSMPIAMLETDHRRRHFGRRKGSKLRARQAGLLEELLPRLALNALTRLPRLIDYRAKEGDMTAKGASSD